MFQVGSACKDERRCKPRNPSIAGQVEREHQGASMIRRLVGIIGLSVVASHALAADPVEIGVGYLGHAGINSKLSLVEQPSENDGIAGARLAIEDNNTTGKFLNQRFSLEEVRLKDDEARALARYLVWKQWKRWLLVVGSHEVDKLYADALRRAAARF